MADCLTLLLAVENYQALPAAPHAEADACAVGRVLEPLGYDPAHHTALLGSQATKTAIESRLRKIKRNPPQADRVFAFISGYAFAEDDEAFLAAFDTQPDDLAATAVSLDLLLDALAACKTNHLVLALDIRSALNGDALPVAMVQEFVEASPGRVCLLAAEPGQNAHASGTLKSSIWTHHLVRALAGKEPLALHSAQRVTAASLHAFLMQELPRTLRSTFREAPEQTPVLLGEETLLLADLTNVETAEPPADPRLQPLRRGVLRSETSGRVKSLAGFKKFHRLPDRVGQAGQKFIADLAAEDIRADVDSYYASVRENMGYKRRDVEGSSDRGAGFVRTPDFEYAVMVEQSPDDPTTVIWRREVTAIRKPEIVLSKPFQQVFGELFDTLVFEFLGPFDLEAWVDQIEEEMPAGVKLRCASDCSSCEVTVKGFAGVIRLKRDRIEVQGQKTPTSKGLVDAFLHFQDLFGGRKDLQALPLREGN